MFRNLLFLRPLRRRLHTQLKIIKSLLSPSTIQQFIMHTHIILHHSMREKVDVIQCQRRLVLLSLYYRPLPEQATITIHYHSIYSHRQLLLQSLWLTYTLQHKEFVDETNLYQKLLFQVHWKQVYYSFLLFCLKSRVY